MPCLRARHVFFWRLPYHKCRNDAQALISCRVLGGVAFA